ncbi:glycosyltransferase family 4 protein [bacterium]|nr:glycosyltransferase family 4 protein [bacterium]
MHIGIDATTWTLPRGFGRHARCLLGALVALEQSHRYTFFIDFDPIGAQLPEGVRVVRVATGAATVHSASEGKRRSLKDMWRLSRAFSNSSLDLLFFPTAFSFVPVFSRARKFVMIHDVTADLFPRLTFGSWRARVFWRLKLWLARWQACKTLTVSEHSRRGMAKQFHLPVDSIGVIPEAAAPHFRPLPQPGLSERLRRIGIAAGRRLLVYVGGFAPFKNLPRLVSVFGKLASRAEFSDVDLILVGENLQETFFSTAAQLLRQVTEAGLAERVLFTGFVGDEDLVDLLNLATLLVLTSFNEGFGLPALEAAACGCPVLATLSSPLPGLLRGGGLYVDPHSSEDIEAALAQILSDEPMRQQMGRAALAAAGELTWESAARILLRTFEEA